MRSIGGLCQVSAIPVGAGAGEEDNVPPQSCLKESACTCRGKINPACWAHRRQLYADC